MNVRYLRSAVGLALDRGDFGVAVAGEVLELPRELALAAERLGVYTPEDLLAMIGTFPEAIAHELGWQPEEVETAFSGLRATLRGHLPQDVLEPEEHETPPTGALCPWEVPALPARR